MAEQAPRQPIRLDPERRVGLAELALAGARAGALGGALGGGGARGFAASNEREFERINREFMVDRARRRARRGLGGTSLEEVGPSLAHHLTEEGRLRGGPGKYFPYAEDLPYSVQERFRLGTEAYRTQDPVTLKDGSRVFIDDTDLMPPEWVRLEEEALARNAAIQPPVEARPGVRLGSYVPASNTRVGAQVVTQDGYPFTKVAENLWEMGDGTRGPGVEALDDALIDELTRPDPELGGALQRLGVRDAPGGGGLYAPDDLEELLYHSEKLKRAQTNPQFEGRRESILNRSEPPPPFTGERPSREWVEGPVSDIDLQKSGISREFLDIDRPTNWVKSRSDEAIEATRVRDMLGPFSGGPAFANEVPIPSRMSRLGSALKSGARGMLNPVSILTDAALGGVVGAGSTAGTYALSRPSSAGLFTAPGPGYEQALTQQAIRDVAAEKERQREIRREQLFEEALATGASVPTNARISDLAEYLGPLRP